MPDIAGGGLVLVLRNRLVRQLLKSCPGITRLY